MQLRNLTLLAQDIFSCLPQSLEFLWMQTMISRPEVYSRRYGLWNNRDTAFVSLNSLTDQHRT